MDDDCPNAVESDPARASSEVVARRPLSARRRIPILPVIALLVAGLSTVIVIWEARCHSPNANECAHLIAGLSHWELQRFDLYRVNPPLVRTWAAIPALLGGCRMEWTAFSDAPGLRPVFTMVPRLLELNGARSQDYIVWGRLACLPIFWLGAWVCLRWATDLYGRDAGWLALMLWCGYPMLLGHAACITPDGHAAAVGLAADYAFWRWMRRRSWETALLTGGLLGLTLLTKSTWIILCLLWPIAAFIKLGIGRRDRAQPPLLITLLQLGTVAVVGLHVFNSGYAYEGTFQRLGDYLFVSRLLSGQERRAGPGNRLSDSWLAGVPVPFPRQFVLGLDVQKADFERGHRTYLDGEWRARGVWYYYVYGFALKTPLGMLLLLVLAGLSWFHFRPRPMEWLLLLQGLFVLAVVSAETSWNAHLRYALPAVPYALIFASRAAGATTPWRGLWPIVVWGAAVAGVGASFWSAPHSLSYFNTFAGGSREGHWRLIESNHDWGQDLLFLKAWLDDHPEVGTVGLACYGQFNPAVLGIDFHLPEDDPATERPPGWYAISTSMLHGVDYWQTAPDGRQQWCRRDGFIDFLKREPVARVADTFLIYHVEE